MKIKLMLSALCIVSSSEAFIKYPIALTSLQVAWQMKDRCAHAYHEVSPLMNQVYESSDAKDDRLRQACTMYKTLKEQLENSEMREIYVEAYRSIGGTTAICICAVCFAFCKR
jgi:hypothetical protein